MGERKTIQEGLQRRRRYMCSICLDTTVWRYPGTLLRDGAGRIDRAALASLVCEQCVHERDHIHKSDPDCAWCKKREKESHKECVYNPACL